MKIFFRIILLVLIIIAGFKTCLAIVGVVASFNHPDATSAAIGEATVPLVLCIVFVWLYRKLAPRKSD